MKVFEGEIMVWVKNRHAENSWKQKISLGKI